MAYPECFVAYGISVECKSCKYAELCKAVKKGLEAEVFRKGTHVRVGGKYKEKKWKPKVPP